MVDFKFCPECGSKLHPKQAGDDGFTPFCKSCNKYWFSMFSTCVIVLVANEYNEIALLKQLYLSDKYLTFTAGYMTPGESAETAAIREVKEELGLDIIELKYALSNWFSDKSLLMLGFIARVKKADFKLSQEVDSAFWGTIEETPKLIFPKKPGNTAHLLYEKFIEDLNLAAKSL